MIKTTQRRSAAWMGESDDVERESRFTGRVGGGTVGRLAAWAGSSGGPAVAPRRARVLRGPPRAR